MPVIESASHPPRADALQDWPGLRGAGASGARLRALVPEVLAHVESSALLAPRFSYRCHPSGEADAAWLDRTGAAGPLRGASEIAFAVATIGGGLERTVSACFARRDAMRALVLRELGILAIFALAKEALAEIAEEARSRGLELGCPLQPGTRSLALGHQGRVAALADARRIGVRVSANGMLSPVNSLSMIVGLGPEMDPHRGRDCESCRARDRCRYRDHDLGEFHG